MLHGVRDAILYGRTPRRPHRRTVTAVALRFKVSYDPIGNSQQAQHRIGTDRYLRRTGIRLG